MLKSAKIVTFSIALICFGLLLSSSNDNIYFQINKSFELYAQVYRYVSSNYVTELNTDDLLKHSLNGMLDKLDPYSNFYEEEEKDDITLISTGNYVGFGITIAIIDGQVTITDMAEGYGAQNGGLRIGDRLYQIDDKVVIGLAQNQELKQYTSGIVGSKAKVKVLRRGVSDTLDFDIVRNNVKLKNVPYSGMLNDSIAIVMLSRFSVNTASDVASSIDALNNSTRLKGVVLDLRDNPGGLLEEAIKLSELFLPKGKLVLTTKGRNSENEVKYISKSIPRFPDIPLTVILNENSASASEVFAGAIQDHDRGVIIGKKSFGKGLVQSVFNLPYNSTLKLTTARYYIPSGRSIQRLEYDGVKLNNSGLNKIFYTDNGRAVYEQNGISPDREIENDTLSSYTQRLQLSRLFFDFANEETGKLTDLPINFIVNDSLLQKFKQYVVQNQSKINSPDIENLKLIEKSAKANQFSENTLANIILLENSLKSEEQKQFDYSKKEIKEFLQFEFDRRILKNKDIYQKSLSKDKILTEALEILKSQAKYNKILATSELGQKENKH